MNDYLTFAKNLAKDAGNIMLEHFKPGIDRVIKADSTPLTIADTQINQLVIDKVMAAYSTHSVMGEEDSSEITNTEYVWVCDPIDGTTPYTFGVPTSMFSLALVKDGVPIVAVLYDPYMQRMFEATLDSPTLLNGSSINVNANSQLSDCYISAYASQFGFVNAAGLLGAVLSSGSKSFNYICITYESILVALGSTAGAYFPGKTAWDIAAVKLIVEQAGGKVTNLKGAEQRYDGQIYGAIVSNGKIHDQLVDLVRPHLID